MATNQYISVKVCGNPDSNSGFVPILLFNSPSFAVEDQFYVGFDNCSYFYTIKTTKTQTIYKLIKNNVRSYGAARAGSLVIAFSVPKNYAIEGGYTPYDVLEKLKNEFLKNCMTCKDSVRETYEFNSGRIDQHVLDEVAGEFTISPHPSPDRVMNPTAPKGYIVKSDAEIEKLFHDLNYPEFDNYSEVVVAESASQTNYIPINNIQIPRPKIYAIYVDGEYKTSCADINQSITVASNKPSEYYNNNNISFTIQNLKDGDIFPGIELQEVNERIIISTQGWATPKRRTISLKIVPAEFENYIFTNRHLLKLKWPYGTITLDKNLCFTLEGEQIAEIKKGTISLDLEPNGKCTLSKYAIYGDELRVTVEEIKRQVEQGIQGSISQHRYQHQERGAELQIVKTSPVYDVTILLKGKAEFAEGIDIDVKLKTNPNSTNLIIETCRTKFVQISRDAYEGHFYVPKEGIPNSIYLYFRIGDNKFVTKQQLSFYNDKAVLEEGDFFVSKIKPYYKNKSFLIKLLIPFLAILFGFIIGFASHDGINNFFSKTKHTPVTPVPDYDEEGTSMTKDLAIKFLKDADDVLRSNNLEFSKIDELYKQYLEFKNVIDDVDEELFSNKVCDRIEDYNKVMTFVMTGDVDQLRKALSDYDYNSFHIWQQHADLLKEIFKDEITIEQFRNNYRFITGFANIGETINGSTEGINDVANSFTCDRCYQTFSTKKALDSHKSSHVATSTFKCDQCTMSFSSKPELDNHKKTKHER